jgi:hypothetical protein
MDPGTYCVSLTMLMSVRFLLMFGIGMCRNHTMDLENMSSPIHRLRKGIQGTESTRRITKTTPIKLQIRAISCGRKSISLCLYQHGFFE